MVIDLDGDLIISRNLHPGEEITPDVVKAVWDQFDAVVPEQPVWYVLACFGHDFHMSAKARRYYGQRARAHVGKFGAIAFVGPSGPMLLLTKLMLRGFALIGVSTRSAFFENEPQALSWLDLQKRT